MQTGRIIHLNDMFFYILRQWRLCLILVIVIGGIYGLSGFSKVSQKYSEDNRQDNIEVEAPTGELSNIDSALYLENAIGNLQKYLQDSILMEINPYEEAAAVLKYQFISSDNLDPDIYINQLEQGKIAYQSVFNSEELYEFVKSSLGVDTDIKYFKELVTMDASSNGIVLIRMIAPDADMAQKFQNAVKQYLNENEKKILKNYQGLEAELDSEYITSVVDTRLSDTQRAQYNNLQALQTSFDQKNMLLSEKGKEYLVLAKKESKNGTYKSGQTLYKKASPKKNAGLKRKLFEAGLYALKRIVLMIGVFIVFFALKYMWSPYLMYAYDLQDMYGVRIYDVLKAGDKERLPVIAEKIRTCMGSGNVAIAGNNITQNGLELMEKLAGELKTDRLSASVLREMGTVEAFKKLKDSNHVIVIGILGKSKYIAIKELVKDIRDCGKEVSGAVIIKDSK